MSTEDPPRGVTDRVDIGVAARLLDRKKPAPMACCPRDGEPLISTMRWRKAEFACMVCGGLFGFLSPRPREVTPELQARHDELLARFKAGDLPESLRVHDLR